MLMNSQEEDAIFEKYGWWKNTVMRQWEAPDGTVITIDNLMNTMMSFGNMAENSLEYFASKHGTLQQS